MKGKVAYVEQQPAIFSDSIRNNILFGRQFKQEAYDRALKLSCFLADLKLQPQGEETIIGQKGTTLSGGQKARLTLARALYGEADIYLLDDPLSAVDSKVGKKIFKKCIKQLSQTKTVILVTHQIGYLHDCDQVIIVEDGAI